MHNPWFWKNKTTNSSYINGTSFLQVLMRDRTSKYKLPIVSAPVVLGFVSWVRVWTLTCESSSHPRQITPREDNCVTTARQALQNTSLPSGPASRFDGYSFSVPRGTGHLNQDSCVWCGARTRRHELMRRGVRSCPGVNLASTLTPTIMCAHMSALSGEDQSCSYCGDTGSC